MNRSITTMQNSPSERTHAKHIVLTSVSSDSHTWNLVFLQLLLEYMGHKVTNLGACTPDAEVVAACQQSADLLVVSTVNGHGHIDGERLIRRVRNEPQLREIPAVIGGKLGTRGIDNAGYAGRLLEAGFDASFEASTSSIDDFVKSLSTNASPHHLTGAVT